LMEFLKKTFLIEMPNLLRWPINQNLCLVAIWEFQIGLKGGIQWANGKGSIGRQKRSSKNLECY
jgi:hypothetical protein